jgi:putative oxidoreductase
VPVMGVIEVFIGLWFLSNRYLTYLFPLFLAHIVSTFVVLVSAPSLAFQNHDPLALTTTGEFVIKNLVLVPAGTLVVILSAGRSEAPQTEGALAPTPTTSPSPSVD